MKKEDIILGNYASIFVHSGEGAYTAVFSQVKFYFFEKYQKKLIEQGFVLYSKGNFDGEDDTKINSFAVYESKTHTVSLGLHLYACRMYVTYTPKNKNTILPPKSPDAYEKKYPTLLTQVGAERFHPPCVSSCYIVRACDGSFVIVDSDITEPFAELLYDVLKKQAPDPENIVISAWIFTHPHGDHVGGFIEFAKKYANDKSITLKQAVYNFPDGELIYDHERTLIEKTRLAAESFGKDVIFIRPHAGDVLYYADLTFRVLYTQEEYTAVSPIPDSNCCSIVSQMETASGVKVLFGADHAVFGNYLGLLFCEGALYNWYGDFIKSDVVTAFHHGFGGGADGIVYSVIKPRVVLWPVTYFRIYKDSDGTPYPRSVLESPTNQYFADPEQAKQNGVEAYYISGDKIQVMDLSDTKLAVTEYETAEEYLNS